MTLTLAPETEARLQAAAAQRGLSAEEVIDVLLDQNGGTELSAADAEQERLQNVFDRLHAEVLALEIEPKLPPIQDTPEQARLRAAFFDTVAKAQTLVPEPYQPNPEQTEEERLFGEIIAEKYRKQGFNLL